ncbi:MAG: glycine cleavage system protein GcvH [Deltaproteobacteria bacterium]|nr:glycine cleavage system protein GcvH [Deltaproteobacteria bacterium]
MSYPENLKYTKDHEWVSVDGTSATMGVTDFAQSELGEIVFADLPAVGKSVKQKDSICVVESTKAASDVYAPIGGKVKETNSKLNDNPGLINSSPYQDGWLVRLENIESKDLGTLMSAQQYAEYLKGKA